MAIVPNRPAALARQVAKYSLGTTVVAALVLGLVISHVLGFIVFVIGLVITGVLYYNFNQVMKTRGLRR